MNRFTLAARLLVLIGVLAGATAQAEIPRSGWQQGGTLQDILDRIHEHASHEAWKQGRFQDEAIEKWLDKVVGSVAKAAEFPDLVLPVRLSEVQSTAAPAAPPGQNPVAIALAGRQVQSRLVIGRDVDFKDTSLKNSIILADGSVTVLRAEGCVIVARGVVTIQMASSNCVIVSGVFVDLGQYDGMPGNATNGSLVVSRGWAEGRTGYGTIVAAPEGISFGRTDSAIFLNAPVPAGPALPGGINIGRDKASRSVNVDLPVEALPNHPFAGRITMLGVSHGPHHVAGILGRDQRVFGPRGIVFGYEGRTHVAEVGEAIVDEEGNAIESLRDWRLSCVNSKFAIFVGPDGNAVLRLEKKP